MPHCLFFQVILVAAGQTKHADISACPGSATRRLPQQPLPAAARAGAELAPLLLLQPPPGPPARHTPRLRTHRGIKQELAARTKPWRA